MSMTVSGIGIAPTPPNEMHTEESLKKTLQDPNISSKDASTAMSNLSNLYHIKDQQGKATDDEKQQMKLMGDAFMGELNSSDAEKLASMLGMSKEKISEINEKSAKPDHNSIR
ncbi:hypothetical protein [Noviherbaspirillum aerium]|uniref:hypothetical protein n=1 Tax=Noviherbaspirillum aerium TaxID=2588497 RepID=UPI00124C2600|nr:hypothetical protein [Noviherbaspirillum aerium]